MNTKSITRGALIGGLYFVLVLLFRSISFGIGSIGLQLRVSELLTVLPFFFPEAILGLTIGCVLANMIPMSPFGWIDIFFGSLCTLIAAYLTYSLRKFNKPKLAYLGIIPPIIVNALGVGLYVSIFATPEKVFSWKMYGLVSLSIFAGQSLSVGIGGSLLIAYLLRKGTKLI
jgi:uncharacterized membrane protein